MSKKTICIICGEEKSGYQLIKHRNEEMNEHFGFCKDCVKNLVEADETGDPVEVMRMLNIPFLQDVWKTAVEKEENNPIGKYLQLIAPKKQYRDFKDSDFKNTEGHITVTSEVISRWGSGLSDEEYEELENGLLDLRRIKEPATTLEEKRYIDNVRLNNRLKNEIEGGKAQDIRALRTTYAQDLKELGLDIETVSKEGTETLGMRIREWEKSEPIPEMEDEFKDVDKIGKYINKYFTIPMKRVFNQATEEEIASLYDVDETLDPNDK